MRARSASPRRYRRHLRGTNGDRLADTQRATGYGEEEWQAAPGGLLRPRAMLLTPQDKNDRRLRKHPRGGD
jgi:hypothetical protein